MAGTDDLAPILAQSAAPNVDFRQGTIIAWDSATGTNTVEVGGAMLTDLPALNLGSVTVLVPGDVVGLLKWKTTYFVLGRIQVPGAPDPNRASIDFDADSHGETNFTLNATPTTKTSLSFTPPSWAGEAAVMVGQVGLAQNNGVVVQDTMAIQPFVNGVGLRGMLGGAGNGGGFGFATAVGATTIVGPFTSDILIEGKVFTQGGSWGVANVNNETVISVMILYRRTA
jgi:hypothetical protein